MEEAVFDLNPRKTMHHKNFNFNILVGKSISEAEIILKGYKIKKLQPVEYVCFLKSYCFGLIRTRLYLYCIDNKIQDYYIITY
ncbi:hypothetical protein AB8P06_11600 [Chryseobacterium sp. MD-1]